MKLHMDKGSSAAGTLNDRFNYARNKDKTRDGELTASYGCDPESAEAEFNLSKAQYYAVTGRVQSRGSDVLCYQIRQSFKPGEVDAETALILGYDLAMRWTKGKHAFFVVSHVDRPHAHTHIYYNATTLDGSGKFRDFLGSAKALRRLSDRICLENNLSVVQNPKLKSRGKFKHYGEWLGKDKAPSFKEKLTAAVDTVLSSRPADFDTFLSRMNHEGFEHKWGRSGVLSFRTEGQKRFTRLRASTLGAGYGTDDIIDVLEGRKMPSGTQRKTSSRRVDLIVDIQEKLREGKGPAYAKWATVFNLKQMAAALQYLQENNLLNYSDLEAKAEAAAMRFHDGQAKLKAVETAMKRCTDLREAIIDYAKTRAVFEEYKTQKYSNRYLAEHESDIAVHRAAKAAMKELLQGEKLPKMESLKGEWASLLPKKKAAYGECRIAQKDMREVIAVKANIDHLLGLAGREKSREPER